MFPLGSFPVYKCDARLTILIFNELIITNSEEQTSRSERVKFFRSFHSFIHTYIHILIYYYYYYNSWHHPFQRPSPWTDSEIIIYTIGLPLPTSHYGKKFVSPMLRCTQLLLLLSIILMCFILFIYF